MPHSMPDAPEGATTTIADNLREVAGWLEAHPELSVGFAFVPVRASDRAGLERLAAALGDRAGERLTPYGPPQVQVEGLFGRVRVYAEVALSTITGAPPVPEYTPIIAAD